MRKYLSLTRVLTKNAMGALSDGKSKKGLQIAVYVLLALCCLPMLGVFYMMFDSMMEALTPLHQEGALLAAGFHIANLVTFLFSIFLIPSVFYFSKDSETLLSLPIKPQVILASKFSVCLLYEYVFTLAVALPLLIAYTNHAQLSALFFVFAIIICLTLPIYPLILSSLITMIVMRFVPFFKNRDRFNMIGGILAVVLAMGFSVFMNSESMQNTDTTQLIALLTEENGLISLFGYLFPAVAFGAKALVQADILQLLIYLGILIVAGVVFMTAGKYMYFKGAIGFNETGSSRKQLSANELNKAAQKRNKITTYVLKEFKLLIRTPVYFLNCIGTVAIMPILFIVMFFTTGSSIDMEAFTQIDFSGYLPYAVLVGFAAGILFSNMNLISSTAISREGTNIIFMKYIPMRLKEQIEAKVYSGIIVSVISMAVMVILTYVVFPYLPISYYIACFIASIVTCILGNYLGILIDMAHPKLVWEQEAAAVKQNMTGMVAMFGSMALCGIMGFAIYKLPFSSITLTCMALSIFFVILCIVVRTIALKKAPYFFERM